jgi:aldose 1-epimerase
MSNSNCKVYISDWNDELAVYLYNDNYSAIILPNMGANVIELLCHQSGASILRTPPDFSHLKEKPFVYGNPILFPPNRIEDGHFTFNGIEYSFPVNEPVFQNHIHGFICQSSFKIKKIYTRNQIALAVFEMNSFENLFYKDYPNNFIIRMIICLSKNGLTQKIIIKNTSKKIMPIGVGFHTAFNIPFINNLQIKDTFLRASVGKQWELNARYLPTEKYKNDQTIAIAMRNGQINPLAKDCHGHYSRDDILVENKHFNGILIGNPSLKHQLVFEVSNGFRHWMFWNDSGNKDFFCPEPQTCMINAPNLKLPSDITGLQILKPQEILKEKINIRIS